MSPLSITRQVVAGLTDSFTARWKQALAAAFGLVIVVCLTVGGWLLYGKVNEGNLQQDRFDCLNGLESEALLDTGDNVTELGVERPDSYDRLAEALTRAEVLESCRSAGLLR